MAVLTDIQKRWVVERLACYDAPMEVVKAFQEEFGTEIDRRQVQNYDAARTYSRQRMDAALVELFDETRRRFREDTEGIPIAQKTLRLWRLDRMAREAERRGNYPIAAQLLEQAAREVGGMYTNKHRHEISGPDSTPLVIAWPTKAIGAAHTNDH